MEAFVIFMTDNDASVKSARSTFQSSEAFENPFVLSVHPATTPTNVHEQMAARGIVWNYPAVGTEQRVVGGKRLTLHAYQTRNPAARMACFMSHYRLWERVVSTGSPILILEEDALFIRRFDPEPVLSSAYTVVGINDPNRATRKPAEFNKAVRKRLEEIQPAPRIDIDAVPQGLAGASAYVMKPDGAREAIELVRLYGAWPNDAILCRQLHSGLGVTRTYYTCVQGRPSTLA